MWLRRTFYLIQFPAAIVLPLWLLIGRGLIVDGPGWETVLLIFVCPILAVLMMVVAALTFARKSVRRSAAVSWIDATVQGGWYLAIAAAGFVAHEAMAALVILISVAAFWLTLWQWFTETRDRVRTAFAGLEFTAVPAGEYRATRRTMPDASGAGTVIRIDPPRE